MKDRARSADAATIDAMQETTCFKPMQSRGLDSKGCIGTLDPPAYMGISCSMAAGPPTSLDSDGRTTT